MFRCPLLLLFAVLQEEVVGNILVVTENDAPQTETLAEGFNSSSETRHAVMVVRVSRESEEDGYRKVLDCVPVCAAFSQGVSLVADLTWMGWQRLQQLSLISGVPYIMVGSPVKVLVQAIEDILRGIRKATEAIIILEDDKLVEQLLYHISALSTLRVYILPHLDHVSVQNLKDMRPSPSFYVVLASTRSMSNIFNTAVKSHLGQGEERWHLVFTDFDFRKFDGSHVKVTTTYVTMSPSLCCELLKLSTPCKCPNNFDVFGEIADITLRQVGQLLGEAVHGMATLQNSTVVDCEFPTSSDTRQNQTRDQFNEHLNEMVPIIMLFPNISLDVTSSRRAAHLASWSPGRGLNRNYSHVLKPVKRFFKVGVAQAIPWSYRVTHPHTGAPLKDKKGAPVWGGYCLEFLDRLARELNFQYELVPADAFGSRKKDGSWNGLIGDLAHGRTDLVVAPLTMTAEREEIVDFVAPYFEQTGISIVIRKPERRTSLFKFMTVLRLEVWLSIVGALVVTGVMIWFLDKYSPYSARNNKKFHPYPCREFTLKESFWFAMTSFTPQGGGETPKALSGRTLVAAYWLFVVLMLATFTANLAAFLTVERMQAPVQSLEQLSRQSRINYTVVKNSDTHSYFRNMKNAEDTLYRVWKEITLNASSDQTQYRVWDYPIKEQYGHILQAIEKAGPVTDADTGFSMVNEQVSGRFALIHDAAEIRYEVFRNCNLTEVGEPFAEQPYAVAVQQGSQLNREISRTILELQQERYFETLNAKYWNRSDIGDCLNNDDNEGITLESLGGVFIATLFGLALAMITLGVEVFFHKRTQKTRVKSEMKDFYLDYFSEKEFASHLHHLQSKEIKLIQPTSRVITVLPRSQLY